MGCDSARAGHAVPARRRDKSVWRCVPVLFLRLGGMEQPPAAARLIPHPQLFSHLQLQQLVLYCYFLMFRICLRGDFSLFSFILMDSKITVKNSQPSNPLPLPGFTLLDWGLGAEQPQKPTENRNGETQGELLQPQGRGGFPPVLSCHLPRE